MTVIAVDGPSASGKGTLARRLARHLGFAYLDTGLIYRAVGQRALNDGIDPLDPEAATSIAADLSAEDLAAEGLRSEEAGQAASQVAAIPSVRAALLDFQKNFAACPPDNMPGAVLDGRDIGTVVCPNADAKLYITASLEVRAGRRLKELRESGSDVIQSRVLEDMRARDRRDQERSAAPLAKADDAFQLDTSALNADEAFEAALRYVEERLSRRSG